MNARNDIGLLLLRLGAGGCMLAMHGFGKLAKFSELSGKFPDPLGVGSTLSLTLAVSAEVGCAALLVLGFMTRLSTIPLIITMAVAAFIVHAGDPFHKKELALAYLLAYVVLFFTGGGKYSLDKVTPNMMPLKWLK